MRRGGVAADTVLEQSLYAYEIFAELENAHEAVAEEGVLFLARGAALNRRCVVLSEGSSERAGQPGRREARQGIAEGNLGQVRDVRVPLQSMTVAPRYFP